MPDINNMMCSDENLRSITRGGQYFKNYNQKLNNKLNVPNDYILSPTQRKVYILTFAGMNRSSI